MSLINDHINEIKLEIIKDIKLSAQLRQYKRADILLELLKELNKQK